MTNKKTQEARVLLRLAKEHHRLAEAQLKRAEGLLPPDSSVELFSRFRIKNLKEAGLSK